MADRRSKLWVWARKISIRISVSSGSIGAATWLTQHQRGKESDDEGYIVSNDDEDNDDVAYYNTNGVRITYIPSFRPSRRVKL